MDQITQEIANTYNSLLLTNPSHKALLRKVKSGKATALDADRFALINGKALSKAMSLHLTDEISAAEYKRIVAEVMPLGLGSVYGKVGPYALAYQKTANKQMGVALQAIEAKYNTEAANAIVTEALKGETYSAVSGAIQGEVCHFAQNIVTDTMKANAAAAEDAGLEVYVTRIYDGVGLHDGKDECKFCTSRCFEDVPYDEALAKDMFRRHVGCQCEIRYRVGNKTQRQSYWEHNKWSDYNG